MALYMGKYCTNQYFDISYLKKLTSQLVFENHICKMHQICLRETQNDILSLKAFNFLWFGFDTLLYFCMHFLLNVLRA